MYEKILVPLDGSNLAEAALPYAEELARKVGSQIYLISVLPSGSESDEDQSQHLRQFYIDGMTKTIKQKGIKIKSEIITGDPGDQILGYVDSNNIDLIIMGTRGRSVLQRWILGSVADKVVSSASCPVALISTDNTEAEVHRGQILRKALVILDGSTEGEVIIPYVEEIASKLRMQVTLLRLEEISNEYAEGALLYGPVHTSEEKKSSIRAKARRHLRKIADQLENKGIPVEVKVRISDSSETIIKVAKQVDADVLALATRGRPGISRWIFGSVRDEIVNIGNTLVLLVRIPE